MDVVDRWKRRLHRRGGNRRAVSGGALAFANDLGQGDAEPLGDAQQYVERWVGLAVFYLADGQAADVEHHAQAPLR